MIGSPQLLLLLVAALAAPVAMLFTCTLAGFRQRILSLLWIAPIPALAAALFGGRQALVWDWAPGRITLVLDRPGAILLGVAALLWIAAGVYAPRYLRSEPHGVRFAVCWLLTLIGNIGVFTTADLASFYLAFALVSIPAYGLLVHEATPENQRAGGIYMALTLLGENFLLMGFILLAAATPTGSLRITDCLAALPASPWRDATLALLIAGFGLKAGLVPLHVWMPLTYTAAPAPAASVLSGAVVKAGVIGLIRFIPFDHALPGWGGALASAGLLSAFYGVAVGITQPNPKTVLAYSSVSQMGLIAAVVGMGLANGDLGAAFAVTFYAAQHILAKGALFLVIGVVAATGSARLWPVLFPAAVLALSLGGLPLTGGALAKLAVKEPLGNGAASLLATLAAAGSTLLMLHFLRCLKKAAKPADRETAPAGLVLPWLAMALAAVVVPWLLYFANGVGTLYEALSPSALWEALWPTLIGALLVIGLRRWGKFLPDLPAGDIVVVVEGVARRTMPLGAALERVDRLLRRWPMACFSLLMVAIILGALMLTAR
jgi:formate hydrogenlyase subunit 3/multisubunit Na+/H+ antiporter MnhD subunit